MSENGLKLSIHDIDVLPKCLTIFCFFSFYSFLLKLSIPEDRQLDVKVYDQSNMMK